MRLTVTYGVAFSFTFELFPFPFYFFFSFLRFFDDFSRISAAHGFYRFQLRFNFFFQYSLVFKCIFNFK